MNEAKTIWVARVHAVTGKGKTAVKNGVRTYTPCTGWVDLKTFTDFIEADEWLCNYARENGIPSSDTRVAKAQG